MSKSLRTSSVGVGVDEVTRGTSEERREECAGWRRKRARGKGCVKRAKSAMCASEPGACGAKWPVGQSGGHSLSEWPLSSRTEPPDADAMLQKPQELQETERVSLVRLVRVQGLSEARWAFCRSTGGGGRVCVCVGGGF